MTATTTTTMTEPMLMEFRQEAATTRRVLERVPGDKLAWKPGPKAMSLGQLALHIATIPGGITKMAGADEFDIASADFNFAPPNNTAEILAALDENVKAADTYLCALDDATAARPWRMTRGEKEIFAVPRIAMLRMILLNHWYHHRGQLSTYLRSLEVTVPSIYGPSADENPFF
jgi:uncharacterized damage-inducible protein DinB